jgi:hypothetical protein
MYGEYHRYRLGGDFEIHVLPCVGAGEASAKANQQARAEDSKGKTGMGLGRVVAYGINPESIVGNNCFSAWTARAEGRAVVKVAFAQGPFYVSVMGDDSGGKSAVPALKEKVAAAARYTASKLPRY